MANGLLPGRRLTQTPLLRRGGVARSAGVVLIKRSIFLNQPPRRLYVQSLSSDNDQRTADIQGNLSVEFHRRT